MRAGAARSEDPQQEKTQQPAECACGASSNKNPVLERFAHQLKTSGLKINHTIKPDFSWSCEDISNLKLEFNLENYILLFPFCSPHLKQKKWPHYNKLIDIICSLAPFPKTKTFDIYNNSFKY